ncbi:CYTH domain-containing protein [Mucilaginibacter koreensis]
MGVEIERKFLVNAGQWQQLDKPVGTPFEQGYLVSDAQRTVRVRATDKHGYITIKGATQGFSRSEYEYEIPVTEARELIERLTQNSVKKVRYCIEYAGKTWEVDDFKDQNAGLLMAELELDSEDEKFELPPWVDAEVTGDKRYYNSYLSEHPFQQW